MDADLNKKLRDTVNVALGVLQKYLRVKRPTGDVLLAPPLCIVFDSAGFCNQYQPDYLGNTPTIQRMRSCGLAKINASHIAPYRQCSLGGGSCADYKGGLTGRLGLVGGVWLDVWVGWRICTARCYPPANPLITPHVTNRLTSNHIPTNQAAPASTLTTIST